MARVSKYKAKSLRLKKVGVVGVTAGRWLLEFLGEMIEMMPGIETPYAHLRRIDGWPKHIPRHRFEQEIRRLKDRGWIENAEKQGKKFLKLTKKGKVEILCRKLAKCTPVQKRSWDGRWRMALFDIPEQGRKERDLIREALRKAGFCRLQKSVYVYPHEVPRELILYLTHAKLLPFVRFVRVDEMGECQELERHYKLKQE